MKRGFASDNNAGVHPAILEAMSKVNAGHEIAYGDDQYTIDVTAKMKKIFGDQSEVFFVFIGTAANVLGLSTITQSYNAIITPDTAHINVDESGAPDKFSGCKLLTLSTPDGKLTVDLITRPFIQIIL
jgi:threonine aldolase